MSGYKVSVIIPVYNAGRYIERAIESVIHLECTGEVLMVDDASSDGSLEVCRLMEKKYQNIHVLEHPDKKNHGAADSRNLGILNAKYEYVSFLDADDYYLPNRFDDEKKIFEKRNDVDGVYGFTLAEYESSKAKEMFSKGIIFERTTFSEVVPSEKLFNALMFGGYGCFHTSAISIKKKLFEKTGLFNPKIRYVEDTELWYKLSLLGTLVAGSIDKPIAIRWVHETNSIHESDNIKPYRKLMYREVFKWAIKRPFSFEVQNAFFIALHRHTNEYKNSQLHVLFTQVMKTPSLIFSLFFIKKLHMITLNFKRNIWKR